jgi:hypothetical protein
MKNSRVAVGAILLLSVAALVMPSTAAYAFGRGGGGGGHFGGGGGGGGHFGGGGFGGGHFGGGGFGGGHFGGGGGGFHLGGGGARLGGGGFHLGGGGARLGGLSHLGGGRIGGLRTGGGGTRLGGLSSGGLSRGPGRGGLQGGLAGRGGLQSGLAGRGGLQSGLAGRGGLQSGLAGRGGLQGRRVAGLGAGALGTHAFANNNRFGGRNGLGGSRGFGNGFGGDRFGRNGFGGDRFGRFGGDRFGHFGRFGGGFGGWVGPVFWPYAFSDIYCDVFWGYWGYGCADPYWGLAFGNPFWGYGYDDIFTGGIFSPYGYDDLAGYLPGATGYAPGATSGGRRARSTVASPSEQMAEMCGNDSRGVADWPIDRIRQLVSPNDQQSMLLDDLANASVQAAQAIKTSCPTSVAFTPTGRLAAMQQRIEGMEQAIDVVQGPLDRFYDSLTDEQKAKLDAANQEQEPAQRNGRAGGLAENCGKNAATDWPEARIEAAVRPNEEQLTKLRALQSTATQAAAQLAASCPSELPTTPPARLAAVSTRLNAMLQAVKSVRVALDDFYGDLSDEQKAQFNRIGQSRTAQR